jgi:hypothetical protein
VVVLGAAVLAWWTAVVRFLDPRPPAHLPSDGEVQLGRMNRSELAEHLPNGIVTVHK